jgi:hypothetical protein
MAILRLQQISLNQLFIRMGRLKTPFILKWQLTSGIERRHYKMKSSLFIEIASEALIEAFRPRFAGAGVALSEEAEQTPAASAKPVNR